MTLIQFLTFLLLVVFNEYMTEQCNKQLSDQLSGRLETSSSLTYDNNMKCFTTISVAEGRKIFVHVHRFELEHQIDGKCVDTVDVFDAQNSAGPMVIEDLCGVQFLTNFTSSANHMTISFQSDKTAIYRGFDFVYVAYYDAPCKSGDFPCATGICIDASLQCDNENQCGDGSDEALCKEIQEDENNDALRLGLIIAGSVVGFLILIIFVVVIVKTVDHYKWKRWLQRNASDEKVLSAHAWEFEYPVTDLYFKDQTGEHGRRTPSWNLIDNDPAVIS